MIQTQKKDEGSIALLLVGLCAVLLLIASVLIAITTVHIERQKLQSLADQTSSAVAVTVEAADFGQEKPQVLLTDQQVKETSTSFLADSGAYTKFNQLTLAAETGASDSITAEVVLTSYVRLPLVSIVLPDGIPIKVTSRARSLLEQ